MTSFPNLANPPSVEAIIELRTRGEVLLGAPGHEFANMVKDRFPHAADMHFVTTQITAGAPTQPMSAESTLIGVRLESGDRRWVVQAKADGLAVSRLTPYGGWDDLRGMLQSLWTIFCTVFQPQVVVRTGVRFLNRIRLEPSDGDYDDVLTAGPKVPAALPQLIGYFQTHIQVPLEDYHALVNIGQTFEPAPEGANPAVLLDIDAYSETAFAVNDPKLWEQVEMLRSAKNVAFFSALTERTLERYK